MNKLLPYNYIKTITYFDNKDVSPTIHILIIGFIITFTISIFRKDTLSIYLSLLIFIMWITSVYTLGRNNKTIEGY